METTLTDIAQMHARIDAIETDMLRYPEPPHDTIHRFTDTQYIRTFIMHPETIWTSRIHRTRHPFFISEGLCSVLNALTGKWAHFRGPYLGVTEPGTRRVLVIHEKTVWTTFHDNPDNERDISKLEARLIEPHAHSLAIAEQRRLQCHSLQ